MSSEVKYCKHCAKKAEINNEYNEDIPWGYVVGFAEGLSRCPVCRNSIIDIPISSDDFNYIRNISHNDKSLIDSLVQSKINNTDEYESKIDNIKSSTEHYEHANKEFANNTEISDDMTNVIYSTHQMVKFLYIIGIINIIFFVINIILSIIGVISST